MAHARSNRCVTSPCSCPRAEDDPLNSTLAAFEQGLAQREWIVGRNVQIDYRWAIDSADKTKAAIAELRAHPPDVMVAIDQTEP